MVGFLPQKEEKNPCNPSHANNMQIRAITYLLRNFFFFFTYKILITSFWLQDELRPQKGMFVNSPELLDFFLGKTKG